MVLKPCKHLDFNPENYPTCDLVDMETETTRGLKCWRRRTPEGEIQYVQFCKKRGRIYGLLECFDTHKWPRCYEPEDD